MSSHLVRNDLSNAQYAKLRHLIISAKMKELYCLPFESRGAELSVNKFPELTSVLERFFEEGGMESHPRLTTSTLFRHEKNNLFMRQARECILMHAPSHFHVSLSTCYNLLRPPRANSKQVKLVLNFDFISVQIH